MPDSLKPQRDEHGHRYWTPELIAQIKTWIEENHFHPGRGIDYSPTPDQLQRHMEKIRSAAGERSNMAHDEIALRHMVSEALNMGIAPEKIIESLPSVAAKLDHLGLGEAARIAGDVIDSR